MVSEGLHHLVLQMKMFRRLENRFGGTSVAVRVSHDVRAACSSVIIIITGRECSSGPSFGVAQLDKVEASDKAAAST